MPQCQRWFFMLFSVALLVLDPLAQPACCQSSPRRISDHAFPLLEGVWFQAEDGVILQVTDGVVDYYHGTDLVTYRDPNWSGKLISENYATYSLSEDHESLKLWKWDFGERCERQYYEQFHRQDALPENSIADFESDSRLHGPRFMAQIICAHFSIA